VPVPEQQPAGQSDAGNGRHPRVMRGGERAPAELAAAESTLVAVDRGAARLAELRRREGLPPAGLLPAAATR
jgi:hypothetical protein